MIERQFINGREVWVEIDAIPAERSNPNIIPTEYFTAKYYLEDPAKKHDGEPLLDEDGAPKLFESPVAALTFASRKLLNSL